MIKDWDIESQLDKWVKEVCSAIGIPEKKVVVEWVWFPMSTHVLVPPPSKSRSTPKDRQSVESLLGHNLTQSIGFNMFHNMFEYVSIFKTCWNRPQNLQLLPANPAEEQAAPFVSHSVARGSESQTALVWRSRCGKSHIFEASENSDRSQKDTETTDVMLGLLIYIYI